jgi:type I restriction enzyme S subunit
MSFSEWREVKLEDIIEIIGGGTPKTSIPEYWSGSIPWISVKDFNTGYRYVYETEKTITEIGLNNSSTKLLNKDDLIISARGTVGALAQLGRPMAFNQSCYGLRAKEMTTNDFVYYLLKNMIGNIQQNTHGSVFNTITRDTFGILKANLPPLEEQKAIARILSTLDDKIEVNNEINKTLENMAQAIFKQWFLDFEFPNEDGEPYKSSGGEMIESDHGLIPKGWEVGKFIDLIEITSGKRPGKRSDLAMEDCKYPLVGASSIMGYTDDFNFEEKILVIGRVGTHGVVQRFNNKVWASDNTLVIKSDNYEFAYQILNQIDYKAINRGSTQPLITQTDIKNYTLIIPTEGYLNKFELLVGSLFEIHSNHCIENSKLTEIRDSLLPKLMSGEIRVPLDEEGDAS